MKEEGSVSKYIEEDKSDIWPYKPNEELLQEISGPEEWEKAAQEFTQFLDGGGELYIDSDTLLLKIKGKYAITSDISRPQNIEKRETLPYEIVEDVWSVDEEFFKNKIALKKLYESSEDAMLFLRSYYGIGYKTQVIDSWDDDKVVLEKEGIKIR